MTTPSAPPPGPAGRGPALPRPTMPPAVDVPDDAVHGDDLDAARAAPGALPTPPPPGGGSARQWLILAAIGGVVVAGSSGALRHSDSTVTTATEKVTKVVVATGSSDVSIRASGDVETAQITRDSSWWLFSSAPEPKDELRDGVLTVNQPDCSGVTRCSVDYTILVPVGTQVVGTTGSGDVELTGALGAIDLESGSGDVDAERLETADLHLETGSGDISVELDSAAPTIDLESGSGDVRVEVPDDQKFAVDVETGSGDSNVEIDRDPAATNRIVIKTGSGDVDVDNS